MQTCFRRAAEPFFRAQFCLSSRMFSWALLALLAVVLAPHTLQAQVSTYAEFTSGYLPGGTQADFLYGGTAGFIIDGPRLFRSVVLSADIQSRFVTSSGEGLDSITAGPRVSLLTHFAKLAPFAEFNVGFARYHDNTTTGTTDGIFGGEFGVTRQLSSRVDAILDYSYSSYGYNSGS